jgi:tetratricopeptide (TPR) repeat protein
MKIASLLLACTLVLSGPLHAAGVQADTVIAAQSSDSAAALLERGLAWQTSGNMKEASEAYSAALAMDGISDKARATALYNRGLCKQSVGNLMGAVNDFTHALFADPEFAQAYQSRGNVLFNSGRPDLALADYSRAIRFKHPQPQLALLGEARAYEALNQPHLAKISLERALILAPGFAQARTALEGIRSAEAGLGDVDLHSVHAVLDSVQPDPAISEWSLVGALMPEMPQVQFSNLRLPEFMDAPSNLLDQAEMVVHSRIAVSSLRTLVLAQTPSLGGPGMVVVDTMNRPKIQDRVAAATENIIQTPKFIRVEAASTARGEPKSMKLPVVEAKPKPSPYVIVAGTAKSEAEAWKLWDQVKSSESALLDGKDAEVIEVKVKRKPVYRLQVGGISTKGAGAKLCKSLMPTLKLCQVNARG